MAVESGITPGRPSAGRSPKRKPAWLNKKIDFRKCRDLDILFKDLNLNTICQQAKCPNISECFSQGVASFLILGNICSRDCRFCAVDKGIPQDVDFAEPKRVAEAVRILGLRHVVITSVSRDDLADGGASMFAETVIEIRKTRFADSARRVHKDATVEVLVPDFNAKVESIQKVVNAKPDIFAHNLETVHRLYVEVRKGADYIRSLNVLGAAKKLNKNIYTKSGIMLGLGENEQEVLDLFCDLRKTECDFLSIGQYLAPSFRHFKVREYIKPEKFLFYKNKARELGFGHIESGPYVRSSYLAHRYIGGLI